MVRGSIQNLSIGKAWESVQNVSIKFTQKCIFLTFHFFPATRIPHADFVRTPCVQNLEGKTYVVGEEFTAADIFLGQTLSVVDSFAGLLTDAYPNTQAYHKRILERPAAKKVYAGEK